VAARRPTASWSAFALFYMAMLIVIAFLDWTNGLMSWRYVGVQIGLMTIGVAIFALIGWRMPNLRAEQGVLLAFTVGVLTIVPAILMGMGQSAGFWPQYFSIASGMAAGSFLGFLFVRLAGRFTSKEDESAD
jgi:hypothetical protein